MTLPFVFRKLRSAKPPLVKPAVNFRCTVTLRLGTAIFARKRMGDAARQR